MSLDGADAGGGLSGRVRVGMTEAERSQLAGFEPELPGETHLDRKPGSQLRRTWGIARDAYFIVGQVGIDIVSLELGGRLKNR